MPVYNLSLPKGALWAAGVCGTLFVGYCIYFDRKRRSDPMFKAKLKEKRRLQKMSADANSSRNRIPDLSSREAMHKYFFEQLQAGEELLTEGDIEGSAQHFCNAIVVSGQPMEMLRSFGDNLPPRLFDRILEILPHAGRRIMPAAMSAGFGAQAAAAAAVSAPTPNPAAPASSTSPPRGASVSIVEDDVD